MHWPRLMNLRALLFWHSTGNPQLQALDDDGGAVGEDFGDAVHELVGVVADGDDGVGSELSGVEGHHGEGVLAGLFAELGEEGDVAADEGLEAGTDGAEDVAGADDDAADDADVADDAVAGDFEGSGDECGVEGEGVVEGRSTFGMRSWCCREYVRGGLEYRCSCSFVASCRLLARS